MYFLTPSLSIYCSIVIMISELNNNANVETIIEDSPREEARFSLEYFAYNNTALVMEMFRHLQSTHFTGISVNIFTKCLTYHLHINLSRNAIRYIFHLQGNTVTFDEDGIREIGVLDMYQYQWNMSSK